VAMGRVLVLLRAAPIFSHQFLTPINYTEQRARCCLPCFCAQREVVAVCCCALALFLLSLFLCQFISHAKLVFRKTAHAASQPASSIFASKSSLSLREMICMPCECRQLTPGSILRSLNHQGGLSGKERGREKNSADGNTRAERKKFAAACRAFPLASFASDIARNRSALFIKSFAFIDGDKSCRQSCRLLYFIVIYFAPFYYCRGKQIYHKICEKTHRGGVENF
jgi:hypothetical protein